MRPSSGDDIWVRVVSWPRDDRKRLIIHALIRMIGRVALKVAILVILINVNCVVFFDLPLRWNTILALTELPEKLQVLLLFLLGMLAR